MGLQLKGDAIMRLTLGSDTERSVSSVTFCIAGEGEVTVCEQNGVDVKLYGEYQVEDLELENIPTVIKGLQLAQNLLEDDGKEDTDESTTVTTQSRPVMA